MSRWDKEREMTMPQVEITKEILEKARDYVPEREKRAFVNLRAERVFDRIALSNDGNPYPDMYLINASIRQRYLNGILAHFYFGHSFDAEGADELLMTEEDSDRWSGSHVPGQVEAWKRDPDVRGKAFNLLSDYKDFCRRFDERIRGVMAIQNDSVIRQQILNEQTLKELPGLMEQLRGLADRDDGK